jgi:hypothetical protein
MAVVLRLDIKKHVSVFETLHFLAEHLAKEMYGRSSTMKLSLK